MQRNKDLNTQGAYLATEAAVRAAQGSVQAWCARPHRKLHANHRAVKKIYNKKKITIEPSIN